MIRSTVILFISVVLSTTVFSQNSIENRQNNKIEPVKPTVTQSVNDTIQFEKAAGGYKYIYNNQILSLDKLGAMMQNNSIATEYFKKAKGNSGFANVLGFAGGFLIGYSLGTAIGGGKVNWTVVGVGCGLIVIAIPIVGSANKNLHNAVNAYNHGNTTSRIDKIDLLLGMNQSGLGVAIRF